jgi:rod shape-determining protein MreD
VNTELNLVLRWGVVLTGIYVLHIGVLTDLSLAGVHPEILLLVGICGGLAGGPARGAEIGFFAGVLADLLLPGVLGVAALSFTLVGFAVGAIEQSVIRSSRGISIAIAVGGSAVGTLLYAALSELLGQRSLSDPRLWAIVGIVSVVNGVLCIPVLGVCRWAEGDSQRARSY